MHVNCFFIVSQTQIHALHVLLSNTHWISLTPWWKHRSWTPSELVEFLKFLSGKLKSISQKAELWIWRPRSPTSDLFHTSSIGLLLAPEQIHPDKGHLWWPAVHRGQRTSHCLVLQKTEPLSSLAAPIISLIPLTSATFIIKEKVIYEPKQKKKVIFTKFVQYTHLIFYGTHCTRRKRAMALKQVYLSSAVTTNEDSWKPVFSVLLEHRAFLMAPAKDHRLLFPSGAMMLHLISPDFTLVSF